MNKAQLIVFGIIGVIILVALLVIFGLIPGLREPAPPRVTLKVWGFEDEELWREIAERYREEFFYVDIDFEKKDPATYENDLLNALAGGEGPDIFVLQNSEISKHREKLLPVPKESLSFSLRDFRETVFDAAGDLITKEGDVLGLPLTVDALALFYNRDYLNSANIASPPKTWEELVDTTKRLTAYSEVGTILRSGIALGTSVNVEHAFDILSSLLIQSGVKIIDAEANQSGLIAGRAPGLMGPAETALAFYTSFADSTKRTYAWSTFFPNSIQAFAEGQTAMMIGYAKDVPLILEKNPHLNFGLSHFPQPSNSDKKVYYARYEFKAVSKQSKNALEAWRLLLWLLRGDNDKFFAEAVRLPPSRRDLVVSRPSEDYLPVFYEEILASKTWPIPDENKVRPILAEMIDSVVSRSSTVETAVDRAHTRLNNVLIPPR